MGALIYPRVHHHLYSLITFGISCPTFPFSEREDRGTIAINAWLTFTNIKHLHILQTNHYSKMKAFRHRRTYNIKKNKKNKYDSIHSSSSRQRFLENALISVISQQAKTCLCKHFHQAIASLPRLHCLIESGSNCICIIVFSYSDSDKSTS